MPESQMQCQSTQSSLRSTYTVATMEVPPEVFNLIASKLRDAGYGHAFMDAHCIDLSGVALVPSEDAEPWRLSKDGAAMVGSHVFRPIEGSGLRKGMKCLLLGPGKTAVLAHYDGDAQWTHYFELPDVPANYIDPYWERLSQQIIDKLGGEEGTEFP
jgi:hypothetical protein